MDMQKLLFVHHYGGIGGAGKSLLNNINLLKDQFDIHVILPNSPSDIGMLLEKIDRVKLIYVDFIPSLPVYSGGFSLLSIKLYQHLIMSILNIKKFLYLIDKVGPDILIVNSIILCWLSKYSKNKRSICFVRETKKRSLANIIQRNMLNNFDDVVFISQFDLDSWNLTTNVRVIENSVDYAIDLKKAKYSGTNKKKSLNVLYLGGTSYIKGFYFLFLSLLLSKNKNKINIIVLGEIRLKVKLFMNKWFGSIVNFEFVGKVVDVSEYYLICDLVIFPVVKVHQGRPIFEAGYYHKGVIAPDFENLLEYVKHDFNGINYKQNSVFSLSKVFNEIIEGTYDLKVLGCNNHQMYIDKHTKNKARDNVYKLISDSLERF
jgi:glycosyltransferase involved in cell wall biosynthesis